MSGHKRTTVTISQEEYRRLYDAERKNYYQAFELPEESFTPIQQQSQSNLMASFNQIENRQQYYEQLLDSFQDQVRDIENATSRSLVDQQVDFYNQLMRSSETLWQDTSYVLQVQSQEFENNIQSQHERLVEQITQVHDQFSLFTSRYERLQTTAEHWLSDIQNLYAFVQDNYPGELIDPKQITWFHNQLEYALQNFENGFYEACIPVCQQLFSNLSNYRIELERDYSQFQAMYQSNHDQLQVIKKQAEEIRTIQAIDNQGELIDEWLDLDYWAGNQRQQLIQDISRQTQILDQPGAWCNAELLKQFNTTIIPGFLDRLTQCYQEARRVALNAQLRFNTAQLVMVSLVNQGYRPEFGQFAQDDMRNGYLAEAKGPDGSVIAIQVEPGDDYSSELHLIAQQSQTMTDAEMKRRSIEIMQSLVPYGLSIGEIEEVKTRKQPARLPGVQTKNRSIPLVAR